MSAADVTRILERLAIIETKIDLNSDLRTRVWRLELAGIAIVVVVIGKIAGVELPVFGD